MRQQRGFTLLELMVAMVIFAALAISGWQVFDSVNRARERAQLQADNLAVLQYAYLQLQQDMGQVIAYQAASSQKVRLLITLITITIIATTTLMILTTIIQQLMNRLPLCLSHL
ncbi:PulJ/GspJ family protein [Psychrobacter sp. TAE2020]|uniref:PulJ/GspJ family protein n=1 Tax=Psychrobacter sp. TAE2020 TaxID=2846762 RepID=UPI002B49A68E|nr:prepilin-type N-terminal cleavage/methylation domain-containing protein [Psychrobacter sp. TAE2020]